jgi:hypothetical protein
MITKSGDKAWIRNRSETSVDPNVWLPVLRIQDVYPGSRILIYTHPGSRISDPKTATKERGEKNLLLYHFL